MMESCFKEVDELVIKMSEFIAAGNESGLINALVDYIFEIQDEIDDATAEWSPLVICFLTAGFFNLVAVFDDIIAILTGTFSIGEEVMPYQVMYVYAIDAFLLASGMLFVVFFLFIGAMLTQRVVDLSVEATEFMRAVKVTPEKAAAMLSYLQSGGRASGIGFKVMGFQLNWTHVTGFLSLFLTALGFAVSTKPAATGTASLHHA